MTPDRPRAAVPGPARARPAGCSARHSFHSTAAAAGVALAGGHSIDDFEPKYGMAVVGTGHPDRVLTNAGGRPGDVPVLTKPVGSGLVTTAVKRGLASDETLSAAIETMTELNREAAAGALEARANAATDVTGFGLTGHLHELCLASGLSVAIEAERAR